jgi:hypothetical protein
LGPHDNDKGEVMATGTIFIFSEPMFYPPRVGDRISIGPNEVGTVTQVVDQYQGRVYVEWDKHIELGSFQARRKETP